MLRSSSHVLSPVISPESEILILGSFPSVKSMKKSFYYMHEQNRFYKVLSKLFDEDFYDVDKETKIGLLNKYHIALYDVIEYCKIEGSSDSKIRDVIPADINNLIKNTKITKIFLNGKKAYNLFIKYNKDLTDMAYCLPSTSSANANKSLDSLTEEWKVIKEFL